MAGTGQSGGSHNFAVPYMEHPVYPIMHCGGICTRKPVSQHALRSPGDADDDGGIWCVCETLAINHEPIRWVFLGRGGGATLPLAILVSRYKKKTQKAISSHFVIYRLLLRQLDERVSACLRSHPDEEGQQDNWDSRGRRQGSSVKKTHSQHRRRLGNTPTQQEFTRSFTELMERQRRQKRQIKTTSDPVPCGPGGNR